MELDELSTLHTAYNILHCTYVPTVYFSAVCCSATKIFIKHHNFPLLMEEKSIPYSWNGTAINDLVNFHSTKYI